MSILYIASDAEILLRVDLITYFTVFVGILRSGCTPFNISPRNSPAAIAHLLEKTGAKFVLLGREPAFQHLSGAAFKALETSGVTPPKTALLPTFEDLYIPNSEETFQPLPPAKLSLDDTAHMFHSSGKSDNTGCSTDGSQVFKALRRFRNLSTTPILVSFNTVCYFVCWFPSNPYALLS